MKCAARKLKDGNVQVTMNKEDIQECIDGLTLLQSKADITYFEKQMLQITINNFRGIQNANF